MMIVVTQDDGKKAAINTEKILLVKGTPQWMVESTIFCEGCNPLEVQESPEKIAEMCNQNQY